MGITGKGGDGHQSGRKIRGGQNRGKSLRFLGMSKEPDPDLKPLQLKLPALLDPACLLDEMDAERPEFVHAVLCQVGLPRSRVEGRSFERHSGNASMLLEAGRYPGLNGRWEEAPLPYGTKPRLVMFHICSEVVRTKRPEVDLGGSMREFLRRVGITFGGPEVERFKNQMRALAAMRMALSYQTADKIIAVKTDPIRRFDAWLPHDHRQGQLWPDELVVDDEFMRTLLEHAVPLDGVALRALSGSALALDVYTWLSHRLCRVRKDGGVPLWWKSLHDQFGQEYKSDKDFKREFRKALTAALKVYPAARVDEVRGGIRLYPSPPPVKKTNVVVKLQAPKAITSADQIRLKAETLEKVRDAAPGWDKYHLEGMWREWIATKAGMPNDPDKAFLGWCKRFTKGKRPG